MVPKPESAPAITSIDDEEVASVSDYDTTTAALNAASSKEAKKEPQVDSKEARYVFVSKLVVMAVFAASAAAAAIVLYQFTSSRERDDFKHLVSQGQPFEERLK
jgi:hypothetical protein